VIEPTDAMVQAAQAATCRAESDECMRDALVAAFAIVERDGAAEAEAVADVLAAFRASRAKGFSWTRGAVAEALRALDRAMP